MLIKVTKKSLEFYGRDIVYVGNGVLDHLLAYQTRFAYNAGMFHNWDAFNIYGVIIVVGGRNLPGRPAEGAAEYGKKADAIFKDINIYGRERQEKIEQLLYQFCKLNGGF